MAEPEAVTAAEQVAPEDSFSEVVDDQSSSAPPAAEPAPAPQSSSPSFFDSSG